METDQDNNTAIFPKGDRGHADYFTGITWVKPMIQKSEDKNYVVANVIFEPGARTNWHTHPAGQILLVTEGYGFYQEKGKPAQVIKQGDAVDIPANIIHWHGAPANSHFAHVAITNFKGDQNVVWLQPVTVDEYNSVHNF